MQRNLVKIQAIRMLLHWVYTHFHAYKTCVFLYPYGIAGLANRTSRSPARFGASPVCHAADLDASCRTWTVPVPLLVSKEFSITPSYPMHIGTSVKYITSIFHCICRPFLIRNKNAKGQNLEESPLLFRSYYLQTNLREISENFEYSLDLIRLSVISARSNED